MFPQPADKLQRQAGMWNAKAALELQHHLFSGLLHSFLCISKGHQVTSGSCAVWSQYTPQFKTLSSMWQLRQQPKTKPILNRTTNHHLLLLQHTPFQQSLPPRTTLSLDSLSMLLSPYRASSGQDGIASCHSHPQLHQKTGKKKREQNPTFPK